MKFEFNSYLRLVPTEKRILFLPFPLFFIELENGQECNVVQNNERNKNPSQEQSQKSSFPQHAQNRSKFVIPKLNGSGGSGIGSLMSSNPMGGSPTPHELSFKKIMDLKRLHISSDQTTVDTLNVENSPPNPTPNDNRQSTSIDLTSALNDRNFNQPIIPATKPVIEENELKFIDCDITDSSNDHAMSVSQDCNLNLLNILDQHFENRSKSTTSFGRILCSKYKREQQPLIEHGFINKHHVKPFNFDVKMKRIN